MTEKPLLPHEEATEPDRLLPQARTGKSTLPSSATGPMFRSKQQYVDELMRLRELRSMVDMAEMEILRELHGLRDRPDWTPSGMERVLLSTSLAGMGFPGQSL